LNVTRLYISADLEGLCGVVSPRHCLPEPDRATYDRAIRQMHREVAIVAETAREAGISDILVNDAHCTMINQDPALLPAGVSLISGKPKPCAMVAGLDDTFDAAVFIGYHAKAGAHRGVLSHTFYSKVFDISVNGVSYGEGGMNALYASLVAGVPLILASGDRAFVEEIHALLPELATVETKVGLSRTAAHCHPWETVQASYREQLLRVLGAGGNARKDAWSANRLSLPGPYELRMVFVSPVFADAAALIPDVERVDGCTLLYRTPCFRTLYRMMQSCYTLAGLMDGLE
jgi:D-amino peptidase